MRTLHYISLAFFMVVGIFIGYAGATMAMHRLCNTPLAIDSMFK